jgi:uncharacterized protein YkwD
MNFARYRLRRLTLYTLLASAWLAAGNCVGTGANAADNDRNALACVAAARETESFYASINALRSDALARPLTPDPDLIRAAGDHARWLATHNVLRHDIDAAGPAERLRRRGIVRRRVGENIARIQHGESPLPAMRARWAQPSQEKANVEDDRFVRAGFALAYSADYCFGVLILTD